jgi:type VI secretion system protein ImpK
LRSLKGDDRSAWERQPLQLKFASNDAGEELIRRIESRLAQGRTERSLLAIFGAVLDLGFKGRFALEGDAARDRLRRMIDQRMGISQAQTANHDGEIVVRTAHARSWTQRISPLACVGMACVFVGVMWLAINSWLDASVTRMVH